MRDRTETLLAIAARAPVIPVVTLDDPASAPEIAAALVAAGLPVVEVTLRTPRALDVIRAIAHQAPEAIVLAGTVVTKSQIGEAIDAGAKALVTPGTSERLADALAEAPIPAMPGCATASEAIALHERGFTVLKFFPAGASGGPAWLKGVAGPLPALRFCPTGGISLENMRDYLACPNVVCVGGTWVTPAEAVAKGDLERIGRLAREAAARGRR